MEDKARAGSVDTKGEKNPRAVMTEEKVIELRRLSKIYSDEVLSDKYNLNVKTVGKIRRGDLWSHIPLEKYILTGPLAEIIAKARLEAGV